MKPQAMTSEIDASLEAWARVRDALRSQLGQDAFQNWIEPLAFLGADHGVGHFTAPTSFIGTWVVRNYGDAIRMLLCKDGIPVSRLEFGVAAARRCGQACRGRPGARAGAAGGSAAGPDVDLPASPLDGRCTFDNFVVGKPNELAHAARAASRRGRAGHLQPAVPLRRRRPRQDAPDARDRLGGARSATPRRGCSTSRPSSSCTASSRRCASRRCTASRRCSARSTC